ncbi:MAG: septum formation initiator family protein [Clostridia bacterium]|nr:septum formation initiator family protein [Clostridia bacterium]
MKKGNRLVKIAAVVFIVFCCIVTLKLRLDYNDMNAEKEALMAQIRELTEANEEIQYRLDMPFDKEYIMSVAREKLNLHTKDEIIFYTDMD